eukprot:jgi/Chlat1/253/Chrsp1S03153
MGAVLFQKGLGDMLKGMRLQSGETSARYINQCLHDCKKEIKSSDVRTKTTALQKLTYLHMMGYDMAWASFHVMEVMSSPVYSVKRIGYLAAVQCFQEGLDIMVLVTNLLRKDLQHANPYYAGLALDCLANIATHDLATDLMPEVSQCAASSYAYVRKKAMLTLNKFVAQYPDGLQTALARWCERLEDTDPRVATAAVNALVEVASQQPHACLPLAPLLYKMLTTSESNWLVIKIMKLLAALIPVEPRLAKKLADPMLKLIVNTHAKSLLYECLQVALEHLSWHEEVLALCAEGLKGFVEDKDQNLRYLGLCLLHTLVPSHVDMVRDHKTAIHHSLTDIDPVIQFKALALITDMVSRDTLRDTVELLLGCVDRASAALRDEVVGSVLAMCRKDNYRMLSDKQWYITLLGQVACIPGSSHGATVGQEIMDIALNVQSARPAVLQMVRPLLSDPRLLAPNSSNKTVSDVLAAAACVTGEYASLVEDRRAIIEAMLQPSILQLPASVQALYVQAVLKVFASLGLQSSEEFSVSSVQEVASVIRVHLEPLTGSTHVEVQERACMLLPVVDAAHQLATDGRTARLQAFMQQLASGLAVELKPYQPGLQAAVPVPKELQDELPDDVHTGVHEDTPPLPDAAATLLQPVDSQQSAESSRELLAKHRQQHNQYYLPS